MSTDPDYKPWEPPPLRTPLEYMEGLQADAEILVADAEKGVQEAECTLAASQAHLAAAKAHRDIMTEAVRLHKKAGQ